jgi:hypothetical protein
VTPGEATTAFRSVSFGDLDGDLWGTAIDGAVRLLALGTPAGRQHQLGRESIEWTVSGERWTLIADGLQLMVDPCNRPAEAVPENGGAGAAAGLDQLCHVSGRITIDGLEHQIECLGTRTSRDPGVDLRDLDSLRAVCAWFGAGEGLTLLSLRPRGAADHSRDVATASVFTPEAWRDVAQPRLSTTYSADGAPTRVGLELWLQEGDEQYPRRVAGEVAGPAVDLAADRLKVRVAPLSCHSRGRQGVGVYLLARRG